MDVVGDAVSLSDNTTKEYIFPRFYAVIDSIKSRPTSLNAVRNKYSFSQEELKQIYNYLCELVESKYLTQAELVKAMKAQFMKYGQDWNKVHETLVDRLWGKQTITLQKFIEGFRVTNGVIEEKLSLGVDITPTTSCLQN